MRQWIEQSSVRQSDGLVQRLARCRSMAAEPGRFNIDASRTSIPERPIHLPRGEARLLLGFLERKIALGHVSRDCIRRSLGCFRSLG
jgi:hypothetical protein